MGQLMVFHVVTREDVQREDLEDPGAGGRGSDRHGAAFEEDPPPDGPVH